MSKNLKLQAITDFRHALAETLLLARDIQRNARKEAVAISVSDYEPCLSGFIDGLRQISRLVPKNTLSKKKTGKLYHANFPIDLLESAITKVGNLFLYEGEENYPPDNEALLAIIRMRERGYAFWPNCDHVDNIGRCQGHSQ